jgi:hypothetical protein
VNPFPSAALVTCAHVFGRGKPYFAGARLPLRLLAINPVSEDAVTLTLVTT